ncbi:hypothetical protein DEO72_LG10g3898 [Vigna unguiculata]|uniref:Uncharacterized protein n=1 Tax=Vigna unguiculata TaxID=3917 RepID=A0A4D6NI24_VIGUN|nr:hypothetical protein DEO72_LG10g3898 [Vigna unguiculata]
MYSLCSPSSIHSCFFSPSFCAVVPLTRASALHLVIRPSSVLHSVQCPSFSAVVPRIFVGSFYLWWSLEEVDSLKEVLLSNCVTSSK